MKTTGRQIQSNSVDVSAIIGGLAILIAMAVIILVADSTMEFALYALTLSTVAMLQGLSISRKKASYGSSENHQKLNVVIYLTSISAILNGVAAAAEYPLWYIAVTLELVLFLVSAYLYMKSST